MSRVYMLRTVPIWNTVYTPVSFFLSGLILGPLALGIVFTMSQPGWLPPGVASNVVVLPMLTMMALGFLGVELLLVLTRIVSLLSDSLQEKQALGLLYQRHKKEFFARLVLSLMGAAALITMLVQSHYDPFCYSFGFAIILAGELLDRYIFYAAREVSRL